MVKEQKDYVTSDFEFGITFCIKQHTINLLSLSALSLWIFFSYVMATHFLIMKCHKLEMKGIYQDHYCKFLLILLENIPQSLSKTQHDFFIPCPLCFSVKIFKTFHAHMCRSTRLWRCICFLLKLLIFSLYRSLQWQQSSKPNYQMSQIITAARRMLMNIFQNWNSV